MSRQICWMDAHGLGQMNCFSVNLMTETSSRSELMDKGRDFGVHFHLTSFVKKGMKLETSRGAMVRKVLWTELSAP